MIELSGFKFADEESGKNAMEAFHLARERLGGTFIISGSQKCCGKTTLAKAILAPITRDPAMMAGFPTGQLFRTVIEKAADKGYVLMDDLRRIHPNYVGYFARFIAARASAGAPEDRCLVIITGNRVTIPAELYPHVKWILLEA